MAPIDKTKLEAMICARVTFADGNDETQLINEIAGEWARLHGLAPKSALTATWGTYQRLKQARNADTPAAAKQDRKLRK